MHGRRDGEGTIVRIRLHGEGFRLLFRFCDQESIVLHCVSNNAV